VQRLKSFARRYWFDALILVAVGVSIAGVILGQGEKNGPDGPLWADIIFAAAIPGVLLARRRFPFGAPVAVGFFAVLASFVDNALPQYDFPAALTGISAVFLVAQLRDRSQAALGLALAVGVEAIVVHNDPRGQVGQLVFVSIIFAVTWIVGSILGRKFEEVDEVARTAVAEERARIARELHDVVGHSVSVMTVQASGVRRLLRPDQERERDALLIVERTGREALAEMRRMVGVLRRPEEAPALAPQPSLEHVGRLIEQAREAGLPVNLRVEGEAYELPPGVDLTAYRLVQEGLTNAVKHARATQAEVVVQYGDGVVEVIVSDNGTGVGNGDGGGHGLVGMRERVSVYGGQLDAGPSPGGGYRLRAKLPIAAS
jgi:signal transduction histidine kinase